MPSCKTIKEKRIEKFYSEWEAETEVISSQESNTAIEKAIRDIIEIEFCNNQAKKSQYLKTEFPKLKYQILQKNVKVIYAENLKKSDFSPAYHHQKSIFKDSLFQIKAKCHHNDLKFLILKDKYKRKVFGRLKYGFGSLNKKRSLSNARVILESHHTNLNYYSLPLKVNYLVFNKSLDSMVTHMASIYEEWNNLYIKENEKWVFVKELRRISE